MKFSKEQIGVLLSGFAVVAFLLFLLLSVDTNLKNTKLKSYRKSIDSINIIENKIKSFSLASYEKKRDIFRFKKKQKKIEEQPEVVREIRNVRKKRWQFDSVKLFGKSKLEFTHRLGDKIYIKINGKSSSYKVGDTVPIGYRIEKEVYKDNGKPTGKKKTTNKVINGKITLVQKWAIFVTSPKKGEIVALKPNLDPQSKNSNLIEGLGSNPGLQNDGNGKPPPDERNRRIP